MKLPDATPLLFAFMVGSVCALCTRRQQIATKTEATYISGTITADAPYPASLSPVRQYELGPILTPVVATGPVMLDAITPTHNNAKYAFTTMFRSKTVLIRTKISNVVNDIAMG